MTILDFLEKIDKTEFESKAILIIYHNYVVSFDEKEEKNEDIKTFIKSLPEETFSAFGSKIGLCLSNCREEIDNSKSLDDTSYKERLHNIEKKITNITSIYSTVADEKYKKHDNVSSAIAQHDESLKEVKEKISILNENVKSANKLIDDKIFTLLINTVAILGIFVAISFTGFGVMSIFSNINLEVSLTSTKAFLQNIFYLLFVALLSYNLLFFLIYFIFKLSRPIFISNPNNTNEKSSKSDTEKNFANVVNLTPFLWIDAIIFVITVALFVFLLFIS